ncbi:MAG: hypothetical protein WC824_06585 [Bacteroidota bacterium]|jgi:hypothetical protein
MGHKTAISVNVLGTTTLTTFNAVFLHELAREIWVNLGVHQPDLEAFSMPGIVAVRTNVEDGSEGLAVAIDWANRSLKIYFGTREAFTRIFWQGPLAKVSLITVTRLAKLLSDKIRVVQRSV